MRRRMTRLFSGALYGVGGILLGLGGVMLVAADPKWEPKGLLVGGALILVAGKAFEWLDGPGDGSES